MSETFRVSPAGEAALASMTPTQPPDLGELRRLAEAATPGPWEAGPENAITGGPYAARRTVHYGRSRTSQRWWVIDGTNANADAAYIAAASPTVVLALIARIEALREMPFVRMTGGDMNDRGRAGNLAESCDWDEWMDLVDRDAVLRALLESRG